MKIGIDARPLISDKPSGIGNYLYGILSCFDKNNYLDDFYLFSNKEISKKYIFSDRFHFVISNGKIGSFWLRYKVPNQLLNLNIEVFWGTEHILPKKVSKIIYILTIHDLALIINPRWGTCFNSFIQNTLCKLSIRQADKILCVSNSTKDDVVNLLKIDRQKCRTIYISDNVDKTTKEKIPISLINRKIGPKQFFLVLGTLNNRKNIINQIKYFDKFINQNPKYKYIYMVFSGEPGGLNKKIKRQLKKAINKNNFVFAGYTSNEERCYLLKNCLSLLLLSFYEGFGIPLLEAMEYNALIIASKNSSIPEIALDIPFYVSDLNDYNEYAKQFVKVITITDNEKRLINEKEKQRITFFSWEKTAESTYKEIRETYDNKTHN
jgi:glycosyltransferase involved in cell wall biosynthesis